ncbi:IclR family transcriptional regulator [Georgenia sp. AZ-5]|uniref:IclR family transcriptional regulator n=1 Tax=Georgenia sp. AZ-5 TaxID=3367526 RepID=UPI00375504B8
MTSDGDGSRPVPSYPIGSVDNALRLLEMFQKQRYVRVAEASRHLGVARSTAHRLLQVLQSHGFVEQEPDSRAYTAGPALIRMAVSVVRGLDLRTVARPVMADLVEQLGETVHLSVLRGTEIFFVESIETSKALRVGARTGITRPAHATAAGRVLLAELDHDELHRLLPASGLTRLTSRTLTSRAELEALLATVRQQGFATSFGESEEEVASVAVPVRDSHGRVAAALAVAAPPSRLLEDEAATVAVTLTGGAERISSSLPG